MRKICNLALSNVRKSRSQALSFIIIIFVSGLFLNLGLITALDYIKSFDQKAEMLNAPDVTLITQYEDASFITSFEEDLLEDDKVTETESRPVLLTTSEFQYGDAVNSRGAAFFNRSVETEMAKFSIVEEQDQVSGRDIIYLPYLFNMSGGYELGDQFTITLFTAAVGKQEFIFTVGGFYEDIYYSTINSGVTGFLLDSEEYQNLEQALEESASGTMFSIQVKDSADYEAIASRYGTKLEEDCPEGTFSNTSHYAVIKSARTMTSSIGASVITGCSILFLIISLVVMNFRIRNSVEEEIRNIGALKALGYTSRQLVSSFLMQYTFLALFGCLLGILCSLLFLPTWAAMFAMQTGVLWEQQFSLFSAGIALVLVETFVCMVSFVSTMKIRKLQPITALRTGIMTHSFRRNPFPLEQSRSSLTFVLAGKQLLHNIKQNIWIGLIVLCITFASIFAGVLYYNSNIEADNFVNVALGAIPHVTLEAVDEEHAGDLLNEVREDKEVKNAFFFSTNQMTCENKLEAYGYVSNQFELFENENWLYKGRFPQYENEIAIGGLLARTLEKEVGDTIVVSRGDESQDYLITGLIQGSDYLGHDLCMTEDGYKRIAASYKPVYIYVYLKDKENIDGFIDDLSDHSPNILNYTNSDEMVRSSMSAFQIIIAVLTAVISFLMLVMTGLVLNLVIKTLLIRKRQELGIQKAIGFTTGQLAIQNALSFLPVIMAGAGLGGVIGYFGVNPFCNPLFSGVGIMKAGFAINVPMLLLVCIAITVFGFVISLLVSLKIRRITPYAMISD